MNTSSMRSKSQSSTASTTTRSAWIPVPASTPYPKIALLAQRRPVLSRNQRHDPRHDRLVGDHKLQGGDPPLPLHAGLVQCRHPGPQPVTAPAQPCRRTASGEAPTDHTPRSRRSATLRAPARFDPVAQQNADQSSVYRCRAAGRSGAGSQPGQTDQGRRRDDAGQEHRQRVREAHNGERITDHGPPQCTCPGGADDGPVIPQVPAECVAAAVIVVRLWGSVRPIRARTRWLDRRIPPTIRPLSGRRWRSGTGMLRRRR